MYSNKDGGRQDPIGSIACMHVCVTENHYLVDTTSEVGRRIFCNSEFHLCRIIRQVMPDDPTKVKL